MKKVREFVKKAFGRLLAIRRKYWLIGGGAVLLVMAVIIALIRPSRLENILSGLSESYQAESMCHEACMASRRAFSDELVKGLRADPQAKAGRRLQTDFLDEKMSLALRSGLLKIIKELSGADNAPDYVSEYLQSGINDELRAEILSIYSMSALSQESDLFDYYFKILVGNENLIMKLAAVRALGSFPGKAEYLSSGQLELMKGIILNSGTDKRLRQPLILLLNEYWSAYAQEVKEILMAYYLTAASGDTISRAFAADSLNRFGGEELQVPEVSPQEWDEYYNN